MLAMGIDINNLDYMSSSKMDIFILTIMLNKIIKNCPTNFPQVILLQYQLIKN
jgi:hypothetical protein